MTAPQTASANPVVSKKRSWRRWFLFSSVTAVGLAFILEAVSWVGLSVLDKTWTFQELHRQQDALAKTTMETVAAAEVYHPYLGWVLNPQTESGRTISTPAPTHFPVNNFGLLDRADPIHRRSKDKFIIAIMGGSVAWHMSAEGEKAFTDALRHSPKFTGREIVLVRLALDGYKQPQQLLLLNYMLALGAEFDAVVNIDGYNEVALHPVENQGFSVKVFPAFPRAWCYRMRDRPDPVVIPIIYRFFTNKVTRAAWASWFRALPLGFSCTANLVWKCRDQLLDRAISRDLMAISESKKDGNHSYQVTGPTYDFKNESEMFEHLVSIWKQSSLQLSRVCDANGIQYFHVLQPNQYLPGSKPIGPEERHVAILDDSKYGAAVARAYPLLIREGKSLVAAGVRFRDLTMLFAETPETIYIDNCCHYNLEGNARLATEVAKEIIEAQQ